MSKNKFSFSLNHIAISVQDVNASVAFYQKVLQLKEIENTASNSKTRWLQLSKNVQLHLIPRPNLKVITNKAVHFAIAIKEIQPFIDHLIEFDIPYSDWTNTLAKDYVRKDGIQQIYFKDIDGYWIEVNNDR